MDENTLSTPPKEADDSLSTLTDESDNQTEDNDVTLGSESDVQTEPPAEESDEYSKAWDEVDTDNPPESIFGGDATTEEPASENEPAQEPTDEEPQVEEPKEGLLIRNPVLKYKGKEIPIESEDELIKLAQKGFKLETEMSKIKPYKKVISIIEEAELTAEDVKALADLKKGNKQALSFIKSRFGIEDDFGFDDEEGAEDYKPAIENQDPVREWFSTFSEENPEAAGSIVKTYDALPDDFKLEIYNPQVFPAFANSVVAGEFEKVFPLAHKEKVLNPALSWLQAYKVALDKLSKKQTGNKPKQAPKDVSIPKNQERKRQLKGGSYDDYWDADLEELEKELFA
jgi:hypothetical protein